MILLDSNIIIYSAQDSFAHLRPMVSNPVNCISAVTLLEVLGYPNLLSKDKNYFETVFSILEIKEISLPIIQQAILLRQIRKISAGDALVAATAQHFKCDIYTRNVSDFHWISGLNIVNPV